MELDYKMNIKFVDLYAQYEELKKGIDEAIQKTIQRGDYILGVGVDEFEKEFAEYCGVKHAIGVANGLSALELSLKAFGIGEGDEVITVANSFVATALAISGAKAKIVLVDCNENDFLIDVSKIADVITPKTKAIIPVDLYGQTCDYFSLWHIANSFNIPILEDASQAQGASYGEAKTGKLGDIAAMSMYPAKNLGAFGDAGIIMTNNKDYYDKLIKLRNYGSQIKYEHQEIGTNSRLSTLNARVLSVKLKKLDEWNDRRIKSAELYTTLLQNIGDIITPTVAPNNKHVFHIYCIRTKYRDQLQEFLKRKDIPTVTHYPIPIHRQKCYQHEDFYNSDQFPVTDMLSKEILSLPMHPHLEIEQIEYIVDKIHFFFENSSHKSKGWFQ